MSADKMGSKLIHVLCMEIIETIEKLIEVVFRGVFAEGAEFEPTDCHLRTEFDTVSAQIHVNCCDSEQEIFVFRRDENVCEVPPSE